MGMMNEQNDISSQQLRSLIKQRMIEQQMGGGRIPRLGPQYQPRYQEQQQPQYEQQYQPQPQQESIGMMGQMSDPVPPDMVPRSVLDNYDYNVEISKRDVYGGPDFEEKIGWDKTVTRYKTPSKADMTDEGMAMRDNKRKRAKKEAVALGRQR